MRKVNLQSNNHLTVSESLRFRFINGEYQGIVDDALSNQQCLDDPRSGVWLASALARTGQTQEAATIWENLRATPEAFPQEHAIFHFFCGIGTIRQNQPNLSKQSLRQLLSVRKHALCRPLIYQYIAFWRYFRQQYGKTIRAATRSWARSIQGGQWYFTYLALDLIGHAHAQQGNFTLAKENLEKAREFAFKIGSDRCLNTIEISLVVYESKFRPETKNILRKLSDCLLYHCEDDYSSSKIRLQIVVQKIIRGLYGEAAQLLRDAAEIVSKTKNHAHTQDCEFYAQIIEWYRLGRESDAEPATRKAGERLAAFAARMLSQSGSGSLWNKIKIMAERGDSQLLPLLLDEGFHGLLPLFLDRPSQGQPLINGIIPECPILFDADAVVPAKLPFNASQLGVLRLLCFGPKTKQDLIALHWQYDYHPLRHDQLIFPVISKVRRLLQRNFAITVRQQEGSYTLSRRLSWVEYDGKNRNRQDDLIKTRFDFPQLNPRQIIFLRDGIADGLIHVKAYSRAFQVSRATASRDLRELAAMGYLATFGKGRGAHYAPSLGHSSAADHSAQNLPAHDGPVLNAGMPTAVWPASGAALGQSLPGHESAIQTSLRAAASQGGQPSQLSTVSTSF